MFNSFRKTGHLGLAAILLLAGGATVAQAQNNVGIGTTAATPAPSAVLDLSSTTQGLLTPRMTAGQRGLIASPATGLLVYQTDAPAGFYFYNGTAWVALSGSGTNGTNGSNGTNGLNALVRTTAEAAGANCASGGTKVESGQDTNGNGTLDAGEVSSTRYVCNGAAGTTGSNGTNGQGVPAGGTAGQVLTKASSADYATQWATNGLGTHTATQALNLNGNNLTGAANLTATGTATLGDTAYPTTPGASGQVLTTDGTGTASWATPAAGAGTGSLQLRANKVGGTSEAPPTGTTATSTPSSIPTVAYNNVLTTPTLGSWNGTTYTVGNGGAGTYLIQARVLTPDATPSNQTVPVNLHLQVNNEAYGSTAANLLYGPYPTPSVYSPAGTKGRGEIVAVLYLNAGDTFKILAVSGNSATASQPISAVAGSNLTVVKLN